MKLSYAGFNPFVLTYTICFIAQAMAIVFLCEVMQRGYLYEKAKSSYGEVANAVPLEIMDENGIIIENEDAEGNELVLTRSGDLHSLSKYFLPSLMSKIFDLGLIIHFASIMITYTLAASSAFGDLFNVVGSNKWVFLSIPFVIVSAIIVVIGYTLIQPVLSFFTFAKAAMLVLMVAITAVVSSKANITPSNDWRYVAQPLLIGTVALGGAYNILPVAFLKVKQKKKDIKIFMFSSLSGLTLVWIFNILWCYFVLRIVPQHGPDDNNRERVTTLRGAGLWGEISTVPLTNIINEVYPKYSWIAMIITLFTVISVTVSFIVNGIALKHFLDGFIKGWKQYNAEIGANIAKRILSKLSAIPDKFKGPIAYISSFLFILIVALINPKGFLSIMEKVTSLALNFTGGVGICWMLYSSRKIIPQKVPMQLWKVVYHLKWVIFGFFSLAMLYDIASWIGHAVGVKYM